MIFKHWIITIAICCCLASLAAAAVTQSPCNYVKCGYGANCEVTDGKPKCVCPSFCPQYILPVCGSDGETYGNSCFLRVSACKAKKSINEVPCNDDGQSSTQKPAPTEQSSGSKPKVCN